eukprot:jgi/Mesen1/3393/ME000192S02564
MQASIALPRASLYSLSNFTPSCTITGRSGSRVSLSTSFHASKTPALQFSTRPYHSHAATSVRTCRCLGSSGGQHRPSNKGTVSPSLHHKRNIKTPSQPVVSAIAQPGTSMSEPSVSAESPGLVSQSLADELVDRALVWASLHGLVVGDKNHEASGTHPGVGLVHAPVALLPTPFPRESFEQAVALATLFNDLADRVSQDGAFLQSTLARAAKTDSFTANLLRIHQQDIRLGMHRSDYMLDEATGACLQVELNTISSSFAGLSSLVTGLHRHLVECAQEEQAPLSGDHIPENSAAADMAGALACAWQEFGDPEAAVLMVVQPQERNMYDQHWLAHLLWARHRVRVVRRSLLEVQAQASLAEGDKSLTIGGKRISVVYYRGGYAPTDYPSEREWEARLLLERSRAVKCPSIAYHLAGAKRIQQELARPGVLERFVASSEDAAALRRSFAGLWSLEGAGSEEAMQAALAQPERFGQIGREDSGMGGQAAAKERVEKHGDKVILNKEAGHLLRTKTASSDEGGVATGFAVLDSPYLT